MAFTSNLRAQHERLLQLAGEVKSFFPAKSLGPRAAEVRKTLSNLAGVLQVHLAAEDGSLYPLLAASSEPEVRDMAKKFVAEMGGIAGAFTAYYEKWSAPAITGDPAGFIAATEALFAVLVRRIDRENNELYPLADELLKA